MSDLTLEDKLRVILEENARIWNTEPPHNMRSILDQIQQTFTEAGYVRPTTDEEKDKFYTAVGKDMFKRFGLMTPQDWYEKFEKEFGYTDHAVIETSNAMAQWALKAARRASGLETAPQASGIE